MKMKNSALKRIGRGLAVVGLALLIAGCALPVTTSHAEEVLEKGKWVKPEHYPNRFNGQGFIYRIDNDAIVIDDCKFIFSAHLECHTPTDVDTSIYEFRKGNYVGYMLNSERQLESLYLLK